MMSIKIIHSDKNKNNLYFSDFFQNQNRSVILLTHYREEKWYHEKINSLILEKLVQLDLQNIHWDRIPALLKEFFLDLNWELYANLRKYETGDEGVSILLAVVDDKDICFVTAGRFLTGIKSNEGLEELGIQWDNFHVKTKSDLGLLGSVGKDIKVRPIIYTIPENSTFVALPAEAEKELNIKDTSFFNLLESIEKLYGVSPFPYCLIYNEKPKREKQRSTFQNKKYLIMAPLMFLMLIFSIYYLFLGRDAVDDRLHITREQFQLTIRNIDILKLQEILPLDYGILLVPQRNIELTVDWESSLPFPVTLRPYFCMRNIYLISHDQLYAYDKRDKKNHWRTTLGEPIIALEILDSNLMIALTSNNKSYCLKRDTGEIVWSMEEDDFRPVYSPAPAYRPIQISLEMDRRLNTGIILFPQEYGLTLINILNGDTLTHYSTRERISYVSEFDLLEKSIYMIKGNKLYKVRFDIIS